MEDVSSETTPSVGSPTAIGVLFLVAAALSVAIRRADGEWPLGLDGWGAGAFVLIGAALVADSLLLRYTSWRN